jgi:hypothetical protein
MAMENDLRRWMRLVETAEDDYLWTPVMYHHTSPENRESILKHGLCKRFDYNADPEDDGLGGVFLTTKPSGTPDVWAVDVRGLDLEKDDIAGADTDEFGYWWVYWGGDIPPSRLSLKPPH